MDTELKYCGTSGKPVDKQRKQTSTYIIGKNRSARLKKREMPVRREAKMKNFALIALIMLLSLSGCASSGKSGFRRIPEAAEPWMTFKQEWTGFWTGSEAAEPWKSFKQEWTGFWN
jgi:hypothetical protein